MTTFSPVEVGKKFSCPWCGTKTLIIYQGNKITECSKCSRIFRIHIIDKPDPNAVSTKKQCGKKIRHQNLKSAYDQCIEILPKDLPGRTAKTLCVYLCTLCNLWHVGHKSKRKKYSFTKSLTFLELKALIDSKLNG